MVSADVYRPAAIKQLETLAGEVGVEFFPSTSEQNPVDIAASAIESAKKKFMDVVIVDTAGRLHIDDDMIDTVFKPGTYFSMQLIRFADTTGKGDILIVAQGIGDESSDKTFGGFRWMTSSGGTY